MHVLLGGEMTYSRNYIRCRRASDGIWVDVETIDRHTGIVEVPAGCLFWAFTVTKRTYTEEIPALHARLQEAAQKYLNNPTYQDVQIENFYYCGDDMCDGHRKCFWENGMWVERRDRWL